MAHANYKPIRSTDLLVEAVTTLSLFNQQAKRLKESRFFRQIQNRRLANFQVVEKKQNGVIVNTIFFDEDAINSFILPLRFFLQNNERCSLSNIAKLYKEINFPKILKHSYKRTRDTLNIYLDEETTLLLPEKELTRRYILDVFLYGFFAHANKDKRKLFNELMNMPVFGGLIALEFMNTIIKMNEMIQHIAININKNAIIYLKSLINTQT